MTTTTYDFTEHDYRAARMQLVRDRDYDAYFDALDYLAALMEDAAHDIIELVGRFGCVVVRPIGGTGHWYYVHPSLRFDGLQYTSWDKFGPIGDVWIDDASDLAEELPHYAFTVSWKDVA